MPNPPLQLRKTLSGDALIRALRDRFDTLADSRVEPSISLTDALMSAFAVYALKMPSLLAYEARRQEPKSNLYTVYHIAQCPLGIRSCVTSLILSLRSAAVPLLQR